ncbi:UNVERIFIED_CONTAM: protein PAT12 [Sesamum angustifolium]|uniref:Protein PAT12 n=1 Tax=Sesamum angustifolium TaxID=2727405 RepID=A0AAW2J721_9LAMI
MITTTKARLAKKSSETRSKYRFCPSHPREQSSRSRNSVESQPHLHVDALGRVCFSSVRRPRPLLLEVDPSSLCLWKMFTQPQDGGTQLRRKRHILLEGLAASLQLVDPLRKVAIRLGCLPKMILYFCE